MNGSREEVYSTVRSFISFLFEKRNIKINLRNIPVTEILQFKYNDSQAKLPVQSPGW